MSSKVFVRLEYEEGEDAYEVEEWITIAKFKKLLEEDDN